MKSCRTSSPARHLVFTAFLFLALTSVPVLALSPQECEAIRGKIKSLERPPISPDILYEIGLPDAEGEAERAARDELKTSGCYRAVRRNDPECLPIYEKVAAAVAKRREIIEIWKAQDRQAIFQERISRKGPARQMCRRDRATSKGSPGAGQSGATSTACPGARPHDLRPRRRSGRAWNDRDSWGPASSWDLASWDLASAAPLLAAPRGPVITGPARAGAIAGDFEASP